MTSNTARAAAFNAFWSNAAPREHLVQMYASDRARLAALAGFIGAGLEKGEVVVLIDTPLQLSALHHHLISLGFDLEAARARQLYFTIDANEALESFMVRDWPDESLLQHFVHRLVARANGRRIRAFSGMQALLVARGQSTAVLRLEHLWHRCCDAHDLLLLCAYPRSEFAQGMDGAMRALCATHTCVVP